MSKEMLDRMPDKMSKYIYIYQIKMPNRMPDGMSEYVCQMMSEYVK